jgi:hypothetical protein
MMLLTQVSAPLTVAAFGVGPRHSLLWLVVVDSLRWFLVFGGGVAVLLGVMMLWFPERVAALEALSNRWVSTRRVVAGGDRMHMALDDLVERSPRAAGTIIALLSLVAAVAFVLLLLRKL